MQDTCISGLHTTMAASYNLSVIVESPDLCKQCCQWQNQESLGDKTELPGGVKYAITARDEFKLAH